jgi:hypothetical protein
MDASAISLSLYGVEYCHTYLKRYGFDPYLGMDLGLPHLIHTFVKKGRGMARYGSGMDQGKSLAVTMFYIFFI